jgi:hypothetical protein
LNVFSVPIRDALRVVVPALLLVACGGEPDPPPPQSAEGAESSAAPPQRDFTFEVETRTYAVKQETPEGPAFTFAAESLEQEAEAGTELVYEEGSPLLLKRSRVELTHNGARDIRFRESTEASGAGAPPVRSYDLPEAGQPKRLINPLMALHPLAPLLPEFAEVIADGYEIESSEFREGVGQVMESMNFTWVITYDPRYDAPAVIAQHDRASGALLRETHFGGWFRDEGEALASTVETTTFLPDGTPVVEKTWRLAGAEPDPPLAADESPGQEPSLLIIAPEPE